MPGHKKRKSYRRAMVDKYIKDIQSMVAEFELKGAYWVNRGGGKGEQVRAR